MRHNGTFRYEIRTDETLNQWGEPVASAIKWSDPIPCSAEVISDTRLAVYDDGEYSRASYIVLAEWCEINPERIELTRRGDSPREFRVKCVEYLQNVGRIKITV